jgi:hypothetical protein
MNSELISSEWEQYRVPEVEYKMYFSINTNWPELVSVEIIKVREKWRK